MTKKKAKADNKPGKNEGRVRVRVLLPNGKTRLAWQDEL